MTKYDQSLQSLIIISSITMRHKHAKKTSSKNGLSQIWEAMSFGKFISQEKKLPANLQGCAGDRDRMFPRTPEYVRVEGKTPLP